MKNLFWILCVLSCLPFVFGLALSGVVFLVLLTVRAAPFPLF
jgi:hypothetical protein